MKRALVLGGGGSKGAYEMGVWKALDEVGMKFDIVTGTSIGALIGTLYVQHDYDKALDLWNHLHVDDVMVNGVNLDMDIELIMSQKGKYADFLTSYMHNKGADISPFEHIIDDLYDAKAFFESEIDYGCMTVNFSKHCPQPMLKKDMNEANVKDYIIASASCFPAFPMKTINDEKFIDGGYHDNVPISLAREMGADEIIAVDLKSVGKNQVHKPQPDTIYIEPYVPLGSFLLFEEDRIQRNMQLGYQDTMKALDKYIGYIYTFAKSEEGDIVDFEEKMEDAYYHIDDILCRNLMKTITKKMVDIQLEGVLKDYQEYEHPYLAILEHIAFDFGMDDLGIKEFTPFIKAMMKIANTYVTALDLDKDHKISIKEVVEKLKDGSKIEAICFIYQYLLKASEKQSRETEMLSVLLNDSFMKAYALYAIQKQFKFEEA